MTNLRQLFDFLSAHQVINFLYSCSMILALTVLGFVLARRFIPAAAYRFISHMKPEWLNAFQAQNTFKHLVYIAPIIFTYFGVNSLEMYFEGGWIRDVVRVTSNILICWVIFHLMLFANALSDTVLQIYNQYPISSVRSIKGFVQIAMLVVYILGISSMIIILLNRDPSALVTTIGGGSIILGLVFRDTIMSFIAGIQIISNNLIQKGDWVEIPKYDANGMVIEVALHVIKVQNFDKTIVALPTYKLVEEGFKNWRGMIESGARRIRRSIPLDQNTIKFLGPQDLQNIQNVPLIRRVVGEVHLEDSDLRTNLELFRAYIEAYLEKHPSIRQDMSCSVRLLEPTHLGLPLQLAVFTNETQGTAYEQVQTEIFEHLTAIVPLFGLRVFQSPSGTDFAQALKV